MALSEMKEKKLGKTLDIYRKIAIAINSFPRGEKISVKDLAEKANVHWNTAKKALFFFHKVGPLIPEFEMESNLQFQVRKKPYAIEAVEGIFESKEMRALTKMMLAEATEPQKAEKMKDTLTADERSVLPDLIEKGYVNSLNGNYYLSKRGQSMGSMGLRKIVELNIPLPWEIQAKPFERKLRPSSSPQKLHTYKTVSPNAPKPIYKQQLQKTERWKTYIS